MGDYLSYQYEVEYEEHFGVQNIDLYYDTPEQWERVYGENGDLKTCAEKESVLQVKKKMHELRGSNEGQFLPFCRSQSNIIIQQN